MYRTFMPGGAEAGVAEIEPRAEGVVGKEKQKEKKKRKRGDRDHGVAKTDKKGKKTVK